MYCYVIDGQKYLESSEDHIKDIVHRLYAALHMDEFQVRLYVYTEHEKC